MQKSLHVDQECTKTYQMKMLLTERFLPELQIMETTFECLILSTEDIPTYGSAIKTVLFLDLITHVFQIILASLLHVMFPAIENELI